MHRRILVTLIAAICTLTSVRAQTEVYSWLFRNGDGGWSGLAVTDPKERSDKPFIGWVPLRQSDSLGKGMLFSGSQAKAGEFLFIYKAFGGLQPNSLYRISTVSSFTLASDTILPGKLHLKIGGTPIRPKISAGRPNFSKGQGAKSGRDLFRIGDIHGGTSNDARRYFTQNYDAPVMAGTNHTGTLYLIIGIETERGTYTPDLYLNTLRILFDYVGKDSVLSTKDFRVRFTETDRPNIFSYEVSPEEEVLRYSVYTREGHLVMVEEDTDCQPDCPNIIDASFLDPDDYLVEFVLPNDRKIIRMLHVPSLATGPVTPDTDAPLIEGNP